MGDHYDYLSVTQLCRIWWYTWYRDVILHGAMARRILIPAIVMILSCIIWNASAQEPQSEYRKQISVWRHYQMKVYIFYDAFLHTISCMVIRMQLAIYAVVGWHHHWNLRVVYDANSLVNTDQVGIMTSFHQPVIRHWKPRFLFLIPPAHDIFILLFIRILTLLTVMTAIPTPNWVVISEKILPFRWNTSLCFHLCQT